METRKSITVYCVFLGSLLFFGKLRSEPQYLGIPLKLNIELSCELQWLHYLLTDLNVSSVAPISVFCDNQSAIYLAHNPTFHERIEHIEIDCCVTREKIQSYILGSQSYLS